MPDKPKKAQSSKGKGRWSHIWAAIGILATLAGLITFLALDLPELIGGYFAPPPIEPAAEDEVLVIVTDFTGQGSEVDTRIFRTLRRRVAESNLERVRVERLEDVAPLLAEEAVAIGEQYGATLVIWGTVDDYGIEPRYEVVRHQEVIKRRTDLGVTTAADLPTFSAYVVESVPKEFDYLMLFSLGQIAYFSEDYQGAITLFNEALNIDLGERGPELNLATVHFYRGSAQAKLDDTQSAIADYTRAVELDPSFAAAYNNRGIAYRDREDLDAAIADYTRAIEADPRYARAHYNRGIAYYLKGDPEAALADYQRAIQLDPGYARAYYGRGLIYYAQGDLDAALADYTRAIELDPTDALAYSNRGLVYLNRRDLGAALADFERAIDIDPEYALAYNNRAYTLALSEGDLDQALADANRAIELEPGQGAYYDTRGLIHYKLGDYDAALADFNLALELGNAYAYYGRGLVYEVRGEVEAALADYTHFLEAYPDNPPESDDARARIEELGGQ